MTRFQLAIVFCLTLAASPALAQGDAASPGRSAGAEVGEAEDAPPADDDGEYHTPLAGEAFTTEVAGSPVDVPERYRGDTLALTLGATGFTPNVGGTTLIPFAALYWKRVWDERRIRLISSVLVNTVDFAEHFLDNTVHGLFHFNNSTIPFNTTEIIEGDSVEFSAMKTGYNDFWVGAGLRFPVAPWNLDNELLVQAYHQGGYHYYYTVNETGKVDGVPVANVATPPDTWVHGLRVRVTLDMIQRNLLELPHYGVAIGGDLAFLRRDR